MSAKSVTPLRGFLLSTTNTVISLSAKPALDSICSFRSTAIISHAGRIRPFLWSCKSDDVRFGALDLRLSFFFLFVTTQSSIDNSAGLQASFRDIRLIAFIENMIPLCATLLIRVVADRSCNSDQAIFNNRCYLNHEISRLSCP